MPKNTKKEKTSKAPAPSPLQSGAHVDYPDKRKRLRRPPKPGLGATNVRAQNPGENVYTAAQIGQISDLFPAGREAFARWAANQGLKASLTRSGWQEHLETFAKRPIHGHRRGSR